MDTIGQVAQVTFLLLLCCSEQGNSATPRSTTTTQSYVDFLKQQKTKSRYYEYYPNYGYEPYWNDGEWILGEITTKTLESWETTTQRHKVCGQPCNYLFNNIKEVCTRWATDLNKWYYGCGKEWWDYHSSLYCTGWFGIDFTGIFMTYPTYCDFLNEQCRRKFTKNSRLILVHVGKCKPFDANYDGHGYFGTQWIGDRPFGRQRWYLSSLNHVTTQAKTTTADPGWFWWG